MKHSYMHAMTGLNYVWELKSVDAAKALSSQLMNEFVYQQGYLFDHKLAAGDENGAFFDLGMGMHPLMDQWSPSHANFQIWSGLAPYGVLAPLGPAVHVMNESFTTEGSKFRSVNNFKLLSILEC